MKVTVTDEEALLRAIWAEPDDDAPRLVYADWLEENGQPERAEFIRVQIELASLTRPSPRRQRLLKRQGDLLILYRAEWLVPLCDSALPWQFHRGLVERLGDTGLFQSEHNSVDNWWTYVGFSADGTVLSVSSANRPEIVGQWFRDRRPALGRGRYTLWPAPPGLGIQFTSVSGEGTVDYRGTIIGTTMDVSSYSHINGHRGRTHYHWVGLSKQGGPD
jgi:uncharacterized protein (TIGR02996 family)